MMNIFFITSENTLTVLYENSNHIPLRRYAHLFHVAHAKCFYCNCANGTPLGDMPILPFLGHVYADFDRIKISACGFLRIPNNSLLT